MSKYHDYYDILNAGKKDYRNEVARIAALYGQLSAHPLRSILEIGCGTGNHTRFLAELGVPVTACDIDPDMLAIAEQKLRGMPVRLYPGVQNLPQEKFSLCVMMWHVLNYFPSVGVVRDVFSEVFRRLARGGLFIFDAWNGVAVIRDLPRTVVNEIEADGLRIVHELNSSTSLMEQRTLILNKGSVYREGKLIDQFSQEVAHYIWTPKVVKDLLKLCGFEVVRVTKAGDYNSVANESDWKICFVTRSIPGDKENELCGGRGSDES